MTQVAILGAGEIGGALAHVLAQSARVAEVRLIDEQASIAIGKALDVCQAGSINGSDTRVTGFGDTAAAAGASVIVVADPAGSSDEWQGEAGLSLLQRLGRLGFLQHAVLICAGCRQRDLMQHALDELKLARRRVIGSAPEALAAALRALVALEARAAARDVALAVLGRPPDQAVVAWTAASIAGTSLGAVLSPAQLYKLQQRLPALWPLGPGVLAGAAALMCEAVAFGSRRLFSCFASYDRDNGSRTLVSAWPVSLGPAGIERIETPLLSARERMLVDNSLETPRETA